VTEGVETYKETLKHMAARSYRTMVLLGVTARKPIDNKVKQPIDMFRPGTNSDL